MPDGDDAGVDSSRPVAPRATSALSTGRRPREVIEDRPASQFFTSDLDGAPRWVSGLLAGLQAALLSLLVAVLPAVAAYVATSGEPANADVAWTQAAALGARWWLLAHGVPLSGAGTQVTLVPLGLSAVALIACNASARRTVAPARAAWVAAIGVYVAVAMLVAGVVGAGPVGVVRAGVGGVVVATLGIGSGVVRRPDTPSLEHLAPPAWWRVPVPVRLGLRAGLAAAALTLLAAGLLTVGWLVHGRATIGGIVAGLGLSVPDGVLLAVAELAYVPTLVIWGVAFLAGPGFAVGAGTTFAPGVVRAGVLPAVPLLGALPQPGDVSGTARALPVLLAVAGGLAGVWVLRGDRSQRWTDAPAVAGVAALTAGTAAGLLVALGSGAVGPGRMGSVGGDPWTVGLAVALGVLVGELVVVLPGDRLVRAQARIAWGALARGGRRLATRSDTVVRVRWGGHRADGPTPAGRPGRPARRPPSPRT